MDYSITKEQIASFKTNIDKYGKYYITGTSMDLMIRRNKDSFYEIVGLDNSRVSIPIRYCPMCGKKLGGIKNE